MFRPDLSVMSAKVSTLRYKQTAFSLSSVHEDASQKGPYVAQPVGHNIESITPNLFKERVTAA
eukprot:11410378-Ditylum_brightwellii.AAC.1